MPTPAPQPVPAPTLPPAPNLTGPLARYLAHPGTETAGLLHHLGHLAAHLAVTAGPAVAGIALAVAVAVTLVRHAQARRLAEGARLVRVLAPPEVDPQGAATLWTNLVALLRPAWQRALGRQPHLGFEVTAQDGGLSIAWWVPGTIPPGLVERAVEAAWPG
ncbi:MAG: type VI secretion protein, partial [Acidimicrobiales bacterium]